MDKISFVLPLKASVYEPGSDLERVAKALLPSLVKYFELSHIDKFLVIVPGGDCREVRERLGKFEGPLKLSVVPEEDVLSLVPGWTRHLAVRRWTRPLRMLDNRINGGRFFKYLKLKNGWGGLSGWTKQQLIKLSAALLIDSAYYVTLDADLCLTRPADIEALLPGGKAIFELYPKGVHYDWWTGSAGVLGIETEQNKEDSGMGVTPVILSTRVVRDLIGHLTTMARKRKYMSIFEYLASNQPWTEYTLYWLFLSEKFNRKEYYADREILRSLHTKYSVWTRDAGLDAAAIRERVDAAFRNEDGGLFLVLQSACVPFNEYADVIGSYVT